MAQEKTVLFKIKRQADPNSAAQWEGFALPWKPGMNVISSLMEIAANPVTSAGVTTSPITYDANCLEEVCGSCAMVITAGRGWRVRLWWINWNSRFAWSR